MNNIKEKNKNNETAILPFVTKTENRYFYFSVGFSAIGTMLISVMDMKTSIFSFRQLVRILMSIIFCLLILIYYYGYRIIARIIFCIVVYAFVAGLAFNPMEVAGSVIRLVCISIMLKNYFIFDGTIRKIVTAIIIVGNVAIIVTYVNYFNPPEGVMLGQAVIKKTLLSNSVTMLVCLIAELYFDKVRQDVFDEVKNHIEQTKKVIQEKEVFFACMSHEIRNPLQSLLGSVELIQNKTSESQHNTFIRIIKDCCEVVLNLVSNILDVAKIEANKMELSKSPADLNENVDKIVRLSRGKAQAKGLELIYIRDKTLPPCLLIDSHRLHQVILNLVSNAIKFTQKGRLVVRTSWIPLLDNQDRDLDMVIKKHLDSEDWKTVISSMEEVESHEEELSKRQKIAAYQPYTPSDCKARYNASTITEQQPFGSPLDRRETFQAIASAYSPNRYLNQSYRLASEEHIDTLSPKTKVGGTQGLVKIEVMDTGIGISKESIEKLFKPFQQADASISKNYGGTGLGLWISKSIVQLMGGDIAVKSKLGLGSNMIVVFPSETCVETTIISSMDLKVSIREEIKGKSCLIVDDIPENTYILRELLENNGFDVTACNRAKEAFDSYKEKGDFDLVVTDLRMPEMTGQALILEIRKYEKEQNRPRVPIIVLTAEAAPSEKVLCLSQYGADDFLLKPIKLQYLMSSVEKILLHAKLTKPKTVLVIEDDIISRRLITNFIRQNGDRSIDCGTVAKAIKELDAQYTAIDLIILDNLLPDGTGVDFMKHYATVIEEKKWKHIPVVSMSGNSIRDQEGNYEGYEIYTYLQKPIAKSQLHDVLRSVS